MVVVAAIWRMSNGTAGTKQPDAGHAYLMAGINDDARFEVAKPCTYSDNIPLPSPHHSAPETTIAGASCERAREWAGLVKVVRHGPTVFVPDADDEPLLRLH